MSSNPSILKYCKYSLSKQFERLHCFVKNMLLITLLIYSVNLVSNNMEVYFSNIPKQTVNSLKLWTLFSSCLVNTQFINLIFAFIVWVPNAIRLESSNGTIKYFINFLTNNAIIQFFFIITCYILSFESVFIISEKSFGLWPIIMSEITMICIANPENNVYLWFIPYELKAKFYPYLIYLILIVSNGFNLILLDVAIGIVFGHLYMFKLKPYLNVRDNVILRTEKACYLITLLPGFVPFTEMEKGEFIKLSQNLNTTVQLEPDKSVLNEHTDCKIELTNEEDNNRIKAKKKELKQFRKLLPGENLDQ